MCEQTKQAPPVAPAGWPSLEDVTRLRNALEPFARYWNDGNGLDEADWDRASETYEDTIALSAAAALVPPAPADVAEPKERS